MSRSFVMKALRFATVNLKDGSVLHLDPDHQSDNRARYPRLDDEDDAERLVEQKLAAYHDGPIPPLRTAAAKDREERRADAVEKTARRDAKTGGRTRTGSKATAGRTARRRGAAASAQAAPGVDGAGVRGSVKGGPGVETDAEAARTAGEVDGEADDFDAAPAA